jgi:hypothetical protein
MGLLLASCGGGPPAPTPTSPAATLAPIAAATAIALPSETPTPAPPLAILLAPPGADPALVDSLTPALVAATQRDGLQFEVRDRLNPAELPPNLRLVAVLPPDPGLTELAAAAPEVQFIGIALNGLQAAPNLSLLEAAGLRPDQQGFAAGFLAAVITPDWRVGVLAVSDTPAGQAAKSGFRNGAIFHCGLCRPTYPPYVQYPAAAEAPAAASSAEWQAAASTLLGSYVATVYVAPGAGDPAALALLAQNGVNLIGDSGGASDPALAGRWVATLSSDLTAALAEMLPKILAGEGGQVAQSPLTLGAVNPALLSPGRQVWVTELLADLASGAVDTAIDPETGGPR